MERHFCALLLLLLRPGVFCQGSCPHGTYRPAEGQSCRPCSVCDRTLVYKQKCTATSNAVCECAPGYSCGKNCEACKCELGQQRTIAGCQSCPDKTFNDQRTGECRPWRKCPGGKIQEPGTEKKDVVCWTQPEVSTSQPFTSLSVFSTKVSSGVAVPRTPRHLPGRPISSAAGKAFPKASGSIQSSVIGSRGLQESLTGRRRSSRRPRTAKRSPERRVEVRGGTWRILLISFVIMFVVCPVLAFFLLRFYIRKKCPKPVHGQLAQEVDECIYRYPKKKKEEAVKPLPVSKGTFWKNYLHKMYNNSGSKC